MTIEQLADLATFATIWAVLSVGYNLADHVFGQTDRQAAGKAAPSPTEVADGAHPHRGWSENLSHVAQYHLVLITMVAVVGALLPLHIRWADAAAGLAVSVVTHAFFDRRWPVRWLLQHIGAPNFAELRGHGMNGMYLTDQALHQTALLASALLITRLQLST